MSFNLKESLKTYSPKDNAESKSLGAIKKFLNTSANCFSRENLKGHIVVGALVVDGKGNVLLNHHRSLGLWLHFGGHSDGEENSLNVAKREVMEESGITDINDFGGKIFDIDHHVIPENKKKNEPAHTHFDICFLFVANDKSETKISNESTEIKWLKISEAKKFVSTHSMIRRLDSIDRFLETNKSG